MLPRLQLIRQHLPRPRVKDLHSAVISELENLDLVNKLPRGATVGVTAGSRGINNIVSILKSTLY